jgi:hypothetical protein
MTNPSRTKRRRPLLIAVGCLVLLVALGVVVVIKFSARSDSDLARMKALLNQVPLPPGSTLLQETAKPAADARATVDRLYQLPKVNDISAVIVADLKKAGYRTIDGLTGVDEPAQWQKVTKPNEGTLFVQPAGRTGDGGIAITWLSGGFLYVSMDSDDVH